MVTIAIRTERERERERERKRERERERKLSSTIKRIFLREILSSIFFYTL